jgi:hypothetical protein
MVDVACWIGARVIVVDTLSRLARLHGDLENASGAVTVLDPFERARALGIACVFVRHARKGLSGEVDDIADAARGSSAITGDMDVVIRLRQHGDRDIRVLSWESRITDDPEDIALEYVDGRYEVVEMPDGKQQTKRNHRVEEMRAALQALQLQGRKATVAALQKSLGWGSHHTIDRYKKIVEEGEHLPVPPGALPVGGS